MRRCVLALLCVMMALAIAMGSRSAVHAQTTSVRIAVSDRASPSMRDRLEATAQTAVTKYTDWLGPPPFAQLVIGDDSASNITVSLPLFDSPGTMRLESMVAEQLALAWLEPIPDVDFRAGAAWYLQSRIVEQMFNQTFLQPGYRRDALCFFGCRVPWALPALTLNRFTAAPNRMARVLTTLERELGWPTLQGALRAAVESGASPAVAISSATGRDLSGLWIAGASRVVIDPAIETFESVPATCESPCYRTRVFLRENGPQPLPLTLRATFADGQRVDVMWAGGRDRFEFESPTRATDVRLDPDRTWQLDQNPLNNARVPPSPTNVPIVKWLARWIAWLQDAMLTQTFPV